MLGNDTTDVLHLKGDKIIASFPFGYEVPASYLNCARLAEISLKGFWRLTDGALEKLRAKETLHPDGIAVVQHGKEVYRYTTADILAGRSLLDATDPRH